MLGIVGASAAVAAIACGSFGAAEGSPVADDAGGPDTSSSDASAADATDAMPRADSGFCATVTTFCDDFERTTVQSPEWMSINIDSLAIDTTTSTSPTRSLRTTIPPTGGVANGALIRSFPPAARILRASMSIRVDELSMNDAQYFVFLFPSSRYVYLVSNAGSGFRLAEQDLNAAANYKDKALSPQPPLGRFVRYTVVVDLDAHRAKVTTDVGSTVELELTFSHAPPAAFRVGTPYSQPQPSTTFAWFDDLTME
jgi:hypothetical protein